MDKVQFGLSNVHVAKMVTAEDGTITYETPFAIQGAVTLSLDPEGDIAKFAADNIADYWSKSVNNGYSGSLEIARIPQQFEEDILGQTVDSNGAVFENAKDKISPFAIGYQIEGDETNTRFWYYNANVSRPSSEANTTGDTTTPDTSKLNITTTPRHTDEEVRAKLPKDDTNTEAYEKFFKSVYEKAV